MTLSIGDIRHTGITVRGAGNEDRAIQMAADRIDAWQAELTDSLPPGARFRVVHHVRADNGGHFSVYRYVTVVEDLG